MIIYIYCRYVAPFESIIEQNYSIIANQYTMTYHKVTNNVLGLQYITLEPHDKFCKHLNNISHIVRCSCGLNTTESHTVTFADANDGDEQARCLGCNRLLDLSTDIAAPIQTNANIRWSTNGSYLLPSGIIVLVNEDIEIYNEGKLLFFKKEELLIKS